MPGQRAPLWIRFWSKVEVDQVTGCWLWKGTTGNRRGRGRDGRLRLGGRSEPFISPHRLVTIWAYRQPPSQDHEAGHMCGQELCCNPAHLYWTSRVQNEADKEFATA